MRRLRGRRIVIVYIFAAVAAVLLSVGAGLVYLPAGLIVAGLCCAVAAVVVEKLLEAESEASRTGP